MKKRTIYITLLLIFIIGIVSIIGTFAIDTTITEGNSSTADYLFNIVLGNRTNREVVIPSYDSKIVDIKISNPNIFNMSYLLYLENTNSNISAINISDVSSSGTIASGSANTIKVLIQNNGSSDTTINVRDIVGFESESLTLPSGGTSINTGTYYKVVVKSNNTSYGKVKPSVKLSTAGGTLKFDLELSEGYEYASNTCGGTVSNNVLTLSNVSSNISCQVNFDAVSVSVDYEANIFSMSSTLTSNGLTVNYDSTTSYLTLNGTPTATSIALNRLSGMSFTLNDTYNIKVTYISGTATRNGTTTISGGASIALDVQNSSNANVSTRNNADGIYTMTATSSVLKINQAAVDEGSKLYWWLWFSSSYTWTFTDYVIKYEVIKDESSTLQYGQNYGSMPTPTRSRFLFDGWYTKPNGGGELITSTSKVVNSSNHTLYAKWKKGCNLPTFTYTGSYAIVNDSNTTISDTSSYFGNWKIRFLSSGTLTFTDLGCAADGIDIFVVGGGGTGLAGTNYCAGSKGGGGGGGGAAITVSKLSVSTGTSYSIVVGSTSNNSSFGVSGTAYFTALAGGNAPAASFSNSSGYSTSAGSGGSGRLSGETGTYGAIGVEVKAGASGNGSAGNYEFFETGNNRYGAGGSFGTEGVSSGSGGTADTPSAGGLDGGGKGGQGCSYAYDNSLGKYALSGGYAGSAATANSGSGGGGGGGKCGSSCTSYGSAGSGGSGASGIVIIRNTRSNESNPPTGTLSVSNSYNTITASVNATDDTGIDHYEYYLSTSSTCPSSGYTKSNSNTYTFNLTNTGTYYVCTRVVDLLNNVLTLKSSSVSISRLYKVSIRYDTNGGTITASTGSNTWTTDSNGLIYRNGSIYEQTLYYENTIDLADYNNSSFINISTGDLYVVSGNEWVCLSGCSNVGKIYNQASSYSTSDFCDLTSGNCTVVLGLRLVEDIVAPTCTISASSSTITAVPADDKGVSKLKYYGWSSTYSGTNSTTKTISTGTHTYYVKDSSDNLGMCSITIESTVDGCTMSNYYLNTDRGKCVLSYAATPHAGGSCSCISQSTGSTNMVSGSCVISGSSAVCSNCPTNFSPSVSSCYIASYTCLAGDSLSGKWCLRYADIEKVCPSGYTKLDDNYCYK